MPSTRPGKGRDTVLITGGGSIGLLIMLIAIKSGASKILISEPVAEKENWPKNLEQML